MKSSYRHTQIGTFTLSAFGFALALMICIGLLTDWQPVHRFAIGVIVICGILFSTLTVKLTGGILSCHFGPGLIRKQFAIQEIQEARPVRNRWYYGWGVRYTPKGWMFNVSGLDAVELRLTSGKKFLIGTDQPKMLADAVQRAIG